MQYSSVLHLSMLLVAAQAQLSHPPLPTGIRQGLNFDGDLLGFLKSTKGNAYTVTPWSNESQIPKACADAALDLKIAATNVEVSDIMFGDCSEAWTVCRTMNSTATWEDIAKNLGNVPVGLRQWTTNILIAPESSGACGLAYNDGHIVIGDACLGNRVLVHELSHQVDAHALAQYHSGYVRYTDSPRWLDIYNNDTHVVTPYAQTNQIENFAELAAYSIMDGKASGGLAKYVDRSEIAMIKSQLSDWDTIVRPDVWSGNCDSKLRPTEAIDKASAVASSTAAFRGGMKATAKGGSGLICSGVQL